MRHRTWILHVLLSVSFMLLISVFFLKTTVSADQAADTVAGNQKNPYANAELTIKIIPSTNHTFGYDILLYGRPLVHQPSIPGLPGNDGFTTKEKAQKVAELVLKKIRNNEMPPSVTIDELNSLGVLK